MRELRKHFQIESFITILQTVGERLKDMMKNNQKIFHDYMKDYCLEITNIYFALYPNDIENLLVQINNFANIFLKKNDQGKLKPEDKKQFGLEEKYIEKPENINININTSNEESMNESSIDLDEFVENFKIFSEENILLILNLCQSKMATLKENEEFSR